MSHGEGWQEKKSGKSTGRRGKGTGGRIDNGQRNNSLLRVTQPGSNPKKGKVRRGVVGFYTVVVNCRGNFELCQKGLNPPGGGKFSKRGVLLRW